MIHVKRVEARDDRLRGLYMLMLCCTFGLLGCPPAEKTAPVASFTAVVSGCGVALTDTSDPGSDDIQAWSWDFGDGGTAATKDASHVYAGAGAYTIALTVTTAAGTGTRTKTALVSETAAGTLPEASFTESPGSDAAPLTAGFTDTSSSQSGAITSWLWSFGDGGTSDLQNSVHVYGNAGSFTVSLTVANAVGSDTKTVPGLITVTAGEERIWYVKPGGTGNGSSWKRAAGSLQAAADRAANAGGGAVWVAGGTYAADDNEDGFIVAVGNNVHLYGGFSGTETSREQRDWEANETVLDGEGTYAGVYCGGNNVVLDGFTIQNGKSPTCGGGVYDASCLLTVSNCVFAGNNAMYGGGIYSYTSSYLMVANCAFENDAATASGGGILVHQSSAVAVEGCSFTSNAATTSGGGIYSYTSPVAVKDCSFADNESSDSGGGFSLYSAKAVLSGCSFTGNRASGSGGGISYNTALAPVARNCTFTENTAAGNGGAIADYASSMVLVQCSFTRNSASEYGGAVGCSTSPAPVLQDCTFSSNAASDGGGGMFAYSSSPSLKGCSFTGNTASAYGGGFCDSTSASGTTLENCTFSGNAASKSGGGAYGYYVSSTLTGSAFTNNTAPNGGGAYYYYSSSVMTACTFSGNSSSSGSGGGIYNDTSDLKMEKGILEQNTAVDSGAGMFNDMCSSSLVNCVFRGNTATGSGGGLFNYSCAPNLMNCTFSNNTANGGGGILNNSATPTITNCILWDNEGIAGGDEMFDYASSSTVSYSCIEGGWSGTGNIQAEPLFVDGVNGDYRLLAGSPCIDAGTSVDVPTDDVAGTTRPQGNGWDIGAYEYSAR